MNLYRLKFISKNIKSSEFSTSDCDIFVYQDTVTKTALVNVGTRDLKEVLHEYSRERNWALSSPPFQDS